MLVTNPTRRPKVTLIGDLLADVWWLAGPSSRNIEHAAMALVSNPEDCKIRPGGVGIIIDALRHADVDIAVHSTFGRSYEASAVVDYLAAHGVNIDNIVRDLDFVTPIKTRYLNENGHILLRHDAERVAPTKTTFYSALEADIYTSDIVVISDYGKGCISPVSRQRIIAAAKRTGTPIFVDTKPALIREYAGVTGFKLNRLETEQIAHKTGDLLTVMRSAFMNLPSSTLLLVTTDGGAGAGYVYLDPPSDGFVHSPQKYSSGNCVGAGDIFFVGLVLGLLQVPDISNACAHELERAIQLGLVAAGQRVRTNGTKAFSPHRVFEELHHIENRFNPARKILAYGELCNAAQAARDAGKSVVFTNGCFDLMHEGHVHTLAWARQQGDTLIVAVDSDDNVRRLKGSSRPVHDQRTRALNLAALEMVDAVYVFSENFPDTNASLRQIIRDVQPAVLVKGADYAGKEIVGQELVDRVALCPLIPDKSTTAFVNKIRAHT